MTMHPQRGFLQRMAMAAVTMSLAAGAWAQFLFGSPRGYVESFCMNGNNITVERFNPFMPGLHPAVIILHGSDGVEANGDLYRTAAKTLAAKGFVAIIVHYFDATGTDPDELEGLKTLPREFSTWIRAVRGAIDYTASLGNVDCNRIGIVGFSLGGYLASGVATNNPRVAAVVNAFGGIPHNYRDSAKSMAPTLIVHGELDDKVPVSEAWELDHLLKRLGACYDTKIYPCEGHIFDGPARDDASLEALSFLKSTL